MKVIFDYLDHTLESRNIDFCVDLLSYDVISSSTRVTTLTHFYSRLFKLIDLHPLRIDDEIRRTQIPAQL